MARRGTTILAMLVMVIGLRAWLGASPQIPLREKLQSFPRTLGQWNMETGRVLEPEIQGVLKADDYLARTYRRPDGVVGDLFVAYYKVQRAGEAMHSPKNCLPGSGWDVVGHAPVWLPAFGPEATVEVNRYVVQKGSDRALVLYWYQSGPRVIASEYSGKAYLFWDALRYNRRDGSLVRIVVPVEKSDANGERALLAALSLANEARLHFAPFLPR